MGPIVYNTTQDTPDQMKSANTTKTLSHPILSSLNNLVNKSLKGLECFEEGV